MSAFTFYQQARELAVLVDNALIELKDETRPDLRHSAELGQMLIRLSGDDWNDLYIRILALVLRQSPLPNGRWGELGNALVSGTTTTEAIPFLEGLARSLEREQADAAARFGR